MDGLFKRCKNVRMQCLSGGNAGIPGYNIGSVPCRDDPASAANDGNQREKVSRVHDRIEHGIRFAGDKLQIAKTIAPGSECFHLPAKFFK